MTNEADYVEWVEVEGVTKTHQGWLDKKERQVSNKPMLLVVLGVQFTS